MGGAFTAVADDATAPWWNPAGMVYLPYREVIPHHAEQFGQQGRVDALDHGPGSSAFHSVRPVSVSTARS